MIDFTPAQAAPRIASLLAAHESRTLDFKRVPGKMVGKALEAICAFANTEGGILVLGVADEKQEKGAARLYPPQYRQVLEANKESVTVTLHNMERPTVWDEVSHWIDTHGEIANKDLCRIADVDTLKASRMLTAWVTQGL